jgi:chitinase
VGESDGFVDLVVSLSQPGQNQVTVDYQDFNSTAGAGNSCNGDFGGVGDSLTFAPGETTKVVRVQIMDCNDVERFDAFTFGLSSPGNAAIARSSTRISIVDNDTVVATPKLTVRDAVVDEKDGFALVSVLLGGTGSESSNSTVTVDYATIGGSATDGVDYTPAAGTLTFAPGETAKTIVVPIADDGTTEGAESFELDLNGPSGATILDGIGVVTIGASDAGATALPGIFAPADVAVSEGSGYVDLVVSLGAPGQNPVSVNYTTSNNTAGAGNSCNGDYSGVSGTLHFALGETTKVVRVEILDCLDIEPAETFHFTITTPVNGAISRATGVITIGDNDGAVTLSSIAVTPANPSIQIGADQQFTATGTFSDAHTEDLTGSATWASATTGVATISAGGLAHGVSAGTSTISATQGAISGSTVLTVTQSQQAQTITFAALGGKTWGDPDFTVAATASSGLPVSFSASGTCTVSGTTVHLTGAGSCTITASQAGNATYSPATPVARSFTVSKADQTITFAALGGKTWGDPDFSVAASASSGLAVGFAASGTCTVSGSTLHITGAGSCTITASQAGNGNYNAATPVARSFTIGKASQTIGFGALAGKKEGDPDFNVSATASSGLPVSFAASGNCTISGARVHLTGAGSCTITASQAGNGNYNAATTVSRSFTITRKAPVAAVKCKVPNVVGKTLAKAKTTITKAHCRAGKITRTYSRKRKKDVVIGQSKRPGRVMPKNTKIDLVVSRGRRR